MLMKKIAWVLFLGKNFQASQVFVSYAKVYCKKSGAVIFVTMAGLREVPRKD